MWTLIIIVFVVLCAAGVWVYVQREIQRSREELKNVDRSKLKDLDKDGWDDPKS